MEETTKNYELLCILSPVLEGDDLEQMKNQISEMIQGLEGTIEFKEINKRVLAYPINKQKQGLYLLSEITLKPEKLIEFSKELKTKKQILRHLITQLETFKSPEEPKMRRAIKPTKKITEAKETPEPQKPKPEKTLEEIDKKLDEIIGDI